MRANESMFDAKCVLVYPASGWLGRLEKRLPRACLRVRMRFVRRFGQRQRRVVFRGKPQLATGLLELGGALPSIEVDQQRVLRLLPCRAVAQSHIRQTATLKSVLASTSNVGILYWVLGFT